MIKAAAAKRHGERTDLLAADVGQRIRQLRHERGMSLAQLGGEDLSRSFLSLVELGRSRISLRALSIVADRLGVPTSYFFSESEAAHEAAIELSLARAEDALRHHQPAEALRLLSADTEGMGALAARWLWLRGWSLLDMGRPSDALPVLEEAESRAAEGTDTRTHIIASYTLGLTFYALGQYQDALSAYQRAYAEASELEDRVYQGKALAALGHVAYMQQDFQQAANHYARARECFGVVNDVHNLAAIYTGLSRVSERQDDLRSAVRYARLGVGIYEPLHHKQRAAHELNQMAARYRELGETEAALSSVRQALTWAMECSARDVESLARSTLAAILFDGGDLSAAEHEAESAVRVAPNERDQGLIDAWLVLARIAERRGRPDHSDELYTKALSTLEQMAYHTRYADAAIAYSLVLRERGDTTAALDYALAAANATARHST